MKNLIHLSGSIVKNELLIPLKSNFPGNSFVCEASSPYANYYGQLPHNAKPNSLFLFTRKFYFLEEILSYAQSIGKCLLDDINIASALIEFRNKQYPAIRIKHFPDYKQLASLQTCLLEQGIEFVPHLPINGKVFARINKLFTLEKIEHGLFIDLVENNKAYFIHETKVSAEDFDSIMKTIKNSTACKLFDAVQGEILQDGNVLETVRIFAEGLEHGFLKCLAVEFRKQVTRANTQVSSKYQHS